MWDGKVNGQTPTSPQGQTYADTFECERGLFNMLQLPHIFSGKKQ
jgi:hypothetical protein